jgi:hypothetical protein
MAFQLSPGVNFSEIDLTNATAAVATTEGAIAGVFRWGPINERKLITSETQLVDVFGTPHTAYTDSTNTDTWTNHETFYTAANFLGYSDALYVTRVVETLDADANLHAAIAKDASSEVYAKYHGSLGNALEVSYCDGDTTTGSGFDQFTGIAGTGKVTVSNSNTSDANLKLTFTGLGTTAEMAKLTKGTKIAIKVTADGEPVQELILAEDATAVSPDGSSQVDAETVIIGAAPTDDGSALTSSGLVVHDDSSAATILATSIVSLSAAVDADADDVHDIDLGDPVVFDAGANGVPAGLVDGATYFAIPVSDATATLGESVSDTTDTRAFKLAAS